MFTPSTYPTGSLSQYSAWVTEGLFSFMRRMQDGTSYITNQYNVAASTPFTRVPLLRGLITQKTDLIIRCTGGQAATSVNASIEGVLVNSI